MTHLGLNSNKDDVVTFKGLAEIRNIGKLKVTLVENIEYKIACKIVRHSLFRWVLWTADSIHPYCFGHLTTLPVWWCGMSDSLIFTGTEWFLFFKIEWSINIVFSAILPGQETEESWMTCFLSREWSKNLKFSPRASHTLHPTHFTFKRPGYMDAGLQTGWYSGMEQTNVHLA